MSSSYIDKLKKEDEAESGQYLNCQLGDNITNKSQTNTDEKLPLVVSNDKLTQSKTLFIKLSRNILNDRKFAFATCFPHCRLLKSRLNFCSLF